MKFFSNISKSTEKWIKCVLKGINTESVSSSGMPVSFTNHTAARAIVDENAQNSNTKKAATKKVR